MVNRGVGYDQELLPWLETYTFPVEARYGDTDFAEAAWKRFLNRMWANGTLRFSAFATIHKEAAWRLMELTEQAGLSALIGKVNMDRNAPDSLREDTDASLADTEELICRSRAELKHVGYILTPRFVPSTTARLMDGPGRLALEELGEVLGRYDGDGQREALAHTRAELSRALEQAREAREKQGRMYQVLGITPGAFLVILLL